MINVLQVLPSLDSGGVERGTVDFAIFMQKHKIQNTVCSSGGMLVKTLEQHKIPHYKLSVHSKNPFRILLNSIHLLRFIKKNNINIIHARSRAPAWSSLIAARLAGINFVTTWHGVYSLNDGFLKRLYNSIMARGDSVIAVSDFIKRHIIKHYSVDPAKIIVINRWVDFAHFDKILKEKKKSVPEQLLKEKTLGKRIILIPARFTEWKGQLVALDLLRDIDKTKYHLVMVGKYDPASGYYKRLLAKIDELKLQDSISIYPATNRIEDFYDVADFILAPTTRPEAFGRVVIEAMYMQKVIIATDIGAPSDNIRHGETGFKISLKDMDDARDLVAKIITMPDKSLALISSNAKKFVKANFAYEKMCEKKLALYTKSHI